jgi:hypothetical protein
MTPAPYPRPSGIDPASVLAVAYIGGAVGMWGTFYDTAWHRTVGRDTFWSLPHLFIYGGGALVWLAVCVAGALMSRGRLADVGGPTCASARYDFRSGSPSPRSE